MARTEQRPTGRAYLALALALTWVFWLSAAWVTSPALSQALHYAGGTMPLLLTLVFLWRYYTASERRAYLCSLWALGRVRGGCWAVVLLLPAALSLLGLGVDRLLGGAGGTFAGPERLAPLLAQAGFLLLFGPIPEELAWRGYAQGRLQERSSPIVACLMLGAFWLVWHLPLSAIEGAYQHHLGLGPRF